ncbi:MAG: histone-lysine N-methyltransferase [Abditibacteriota bacterium]|nr:histone-lysine N-methyltransferase [Abditibacteriota bacterium]
MISRNPDWGYIEPGKRFEIKNPESPNLLRDMYPYSEVPKILFDGCSVPIEPAKEFYITDTTFRDGQQARPPYSADQIAAIYEMLSRLGGPKGIIRASEFFLYSEKDKEAVRKCQELGLEFPRITGWIRATKSDFAIVKEMGLKETGILTSASDYHIYLKLKKNREQVLAQYIDLVTTALDSGLDAVRCHLEDVTRADFYGFVVPFVQQLMEIAHQAKKIIRIRLCDTMGYGVPYAEAVLPRSIPKMIHAIRHECGVPSDWIEWHGHNDFHKVQVNATTAWLYGCAGANCALLGFGERTGNPPLEGAVMDYISLRGETDGIDTRVITEIADYFRTEIGHDIPSNYPFIGMNFNVTSAGVHADGMLKNEEIYNIFDTGKILDKPARVNVTDKSGIAGVAHWVNNYLGLKPESRLDKRHPGLVAINKWIIEQYAAGRVTSISDREMHMQAQMHLPEYFKSDYEKLRDHAMAISEKIIQRLAENEDMISMNPEKMTPVLNEAVEKNAFIQLAYVVDPNGKMIAESDSMTPEIKKAIDMSEDLSDRDWFKGAMESGDVYITGFYKSRYTGALCVTLSSQIVDDNGECLGIVGADLRFEDLVRTNEVLLQ